MNVQLQENNPALFPSQNDASTEADVQQVIALLRIGQIFCERSDQQIEQLCQEVAYITRGRAQLVLFSQTKHSAAHLHHEQPGQFPVLFRNRVYGFLSIVTNTYHSEQLFLSDIFSSLLAQVCGWIIYTYEQGKFLQGQARQVQVQKPLQKPLTRREHEVLKLLNQGLTQEEIADTLCIARTTVIKHKQNIYALLNVHTEKDALIVAYQLGLLSTVGQILNP